MIDTDKYESMRLLFLDFIDTASDEVDEEAWRNKLTMLDDLLAEVKRMQYWDEEMDRVIAHLAQHNWASSDGDVHEIVEYVLTEVERLTEFRDKVLTAFVEMPQNKRSLTYLLYESGYLNHYSRADYLKGLHPHGLGLFELKDEWMEKAQQYLESEEE